MVGVIVHPAQVQEIATADRELIGTAYPCTNLLRLQNVYKITETEMKVSIEEARKFHGHLGAYLIIGIRIGEYAMEQLDANPHFDVEVEVECPSRPPVRCLVDGLQLSTGATYGKGNIKVKPQNKQVTVKVVSRKACRRIQLELHPDIPTKIARWYQETSEAEVVQTVLAMDNSALFRVVENS